ncbi:MAG: hypothetical protein M3Z23_00255 [Acidobacteriota bacterium]|nr:hypothetical protein [Acidobacteriota bacterium]
MQRIARVHLATSFLLCAGFAHAEWVQSRSGPFEIFSDANARAARETLADFEQFRHALGYTLQKPDLQLDPRIRILLFKNAKERELPGSAPGLVRGRDRYDVLGSADSAIPQPVFAECTRVFLERNVDRLPPAIEQGLEAFFSTIEVHGTHVAWGAPPANRTRDWARIHLLIANPDYYAKTRVLLFNLQKGVAEDAAYRNALGESRQDFEARVDRYWTAGVFPKSEAPSRPLSPERDLHTSPVEPESVSLAMADLLNDRSQASYETMIRDHVHATEAEEGLALLALKSNDTAAAREHLSRAIESGSKNPAVFVDYARLDNDAPKAKAALEKAIELDPNLAEAHFLLGEQSPDAAKKIAEWNIAAKLAPRATGYWEALAKLYLEQQKFPEAAKAWRSAEQAAATEPERDRMREARLAIERQRLDAEEAGRRRVAEEKQRDINRLKTKAIADLRAAEAKASGPPLPSSVSDRAVPWWDGPKAAARAEGVLKQVDCIGKQARLVLLKDDGKLARLLVRDPSQIVLAGGEEKMLGCGAQTPRRVTIEYFPKMNAKLGTSGEVATVEFQR